MPKKAVLLTEDDLTTLQRLVRRERDRISTRPNRNTPEPELGTAPEVYVARTGSGIPAINLRPGADVWTGTGTGTGPGDWDEPGYANCEIYQVLEAGATGPGTPYLDHIPGLTRRVHNLGIIAIPANTWILVERDKFGIWWVTFDGSNSGGLQPPNPAGVGNSFGCITSVGIECDDGVATVFYSLAVHSAYVLINGVQYPVTFI